MVFLSQDSSSDCTQGPNRGRQGAGVQGVRNRLSIMLGQGSNLDEEEEKGGGLRGRIEVLKDRIKGSLITTG